MVFYTDELRDLSVLRDLSGSQRFEFVGLADSRHVTVVVVIVVVVVIENSDLHLL